MIQRKLFDKEMHLVRRSRGGGYGAWKKHSTVLFVHGRRGSGKTTFLLHLAEKENALYFPFRNLGNRQALDLFVRQLGHEESVGAVSTWSEAFAMVSEHAGRYRKVMLDDFDIAMQNKEFAAAFQTWRADTTRPNLFIILAVTDKEIMTEKETGYSHYAVELYHYAVTEVQQALPERTVQEVVDVYAITGGVPELVPLFAGEQPVWDCLTKACAPGSLLVEWFPRMMNETFRSPQVYYEILYAVACGCIRVSEIGTATGYPYNKCNSYIKNLIAADVLEAYTMTTEAGVEKTGYRFACSYYKLWMQVIYTNQTAFSAGRAAETLERYRADIETLVQEEYRAACYRTVGQRQLHCRIAPEKIYDRPFDVETDKDNYHFDYFNKNEAGQGLYVKVFCADDAPYGMEEDNALGEAAAKNCPIYKGEAFVFCIVPYTKQVLKSCRGSDTFHLRGVQHLLYPAGYSKPSARKGDEPAGENLDASLYEGFD